jgi:signal peptidase II
VPERSRRLFLTIVASAIVLVDQLTKAVIVSAIGPRASVSHVDILGDWLSLEYAENRGVAFGIFAGLGPVLPWASLVIVAVMLAHYFHSPSPPQWETLSIALIAGGAIGNLVDRARLGYVIDFIAVGAWPNFNVADSAITVGVLIAIWGWMVREPRQSSSGAGSG